MDTVRRNSGTIYLVLKEWSNDPYEDYQQQVEIQSCESCSALVLVDEMELHVAWHQDQRAS